MDSIPPVAMPCTSTESQEPVRGRLRAKLLRLLLIAAPLLVPVGRADATLEVLSTTQLARRADVVAIGTVDQVTSAWEDGRIVTSAVVRVEGSLKGSGGDSLGVRALGGTVDGIGMRVGGAPVFHAGDRSIFFLRRGSTADEAYPYRVLGGALGKVDIHRHDDGRQTVLWIRPELRRVDEVELADFAEHVTREAREAP